MKKVKMLFGVVYFGTKKNRFITREQALKIVSDINKLLQKSDIKKIASIQYKDKKSYNKYNINFNGIGVQKHETFTFYTEYKKSFKEELADAICSKNRNFYRRNFIVDLNGRLTQCRCWTIDLPYAKVVKKALNIIQKNTNNAFHIKWF